MWSTSKNTQLRTTIIAVMVIVVVGVVGIFIVLGNTLNHIFPSSHIPISNSMEPYELDFRTDIHNSTRLPKDAPSLQWKLNVPRAFLVNILGENGAVRGGPKADDLFMAYIYAIVLPNNSELSPAALEPYDKPITRFTSLKRFIALSMSNQSTEVKMLGPDACVTDDDYKKVLEAHGARNERDRRCLPQANLCGIYSHLDGWEFEMHVTRDIYSDPENVCRVAKAFLNKHTVHRGDLR